MFAVIKTGGKQYKVAENDVITIEQLGSEPGSKVNFDTVLMVNSKAGVTLGSPTVKGASVSAEVLENKRTRKVLVFKKRRRKNSRRLNGHRQAVTVVKITGIKG